MAQTTNFLSTLTGSFSSPAAGNPTRAMVEAAYRHHRIDARYINCEVASPDLPDAVRGALAMGWIGFNCSTPHKIAVVPLLDELAPSAALIGAVNCVVRRGLRLVGENTDGQGFLASLRTVVDPAGRHVVILGAGGAARAIAVEAAMAGAARVTIVNRNQARAAEIAALLNESTPARAESIPWSGPYRIPDDAHVVVNATSVGLFPDVEAEVNIAVDSLRPHLVVADVIPNPPRTRLLRDAASRGCTTLDGLGMLVNQAAIGLRLWLDIGVDRKVMRQTLDRIFSSAAG
jgi:shikimate dehydrogenase